MKTRETLEQTIKRLQTEWDEKEARALDAQTDFEDVQERYRKAKAELEALD